MIPGILAITIIFICVIGEAFFSGSEIAIVSIDKIKLRHSAKQGRHSSNLILKMLKRPEKILGTTLVGTNVFTITGTTIAASLFYGMLGEIGIPVSIVVMAFINWIFAEIVPKSIFQQLSDTMTPKIIYILRLFYFLFFPVVWIFSEMALILTRLLGGGKGEGNQFISKEELRLLMKMKDTKGDVKPGEKQMITRLLGFSETSIKEIMVPLINVEALSKKASVAESTEKFVRTKHRRLPIFSGRIDRITGILNSFDIMAENPEKSIKSFIRSAYYVPATVSPADLLKQLQMNGMNMAIVVDEFGGAEGIVTIEDILEEIVGEIDDEYDKIQKPYKIREDGSIILNGRMEIDEVNEIFALNIPEGDYETIGGFVISSLNRIPKVGEKISLLNVNLIIYRATARIVLEIEIRKKNNL